MKTIIASLKFLAISAAITCLLPNNAVAANNPIPGVDIIIKKQPGDKLMKATTDSSGKFSFTKLEPGTYKVTITPKAKGDATAAKAPVNTSRSNITRPSMKVVNGVEVYDLVVSLGTNAASCEIVVGMGGGTISGTVISNDATAENAEKALPTGKRMHKPL